MPDEIWKDIAGYEGYYQVSSTGIVRSLDRHDCIKRFRPAQIMTQSNDSDGYKVVTLSKGGKQRTAKVHQLVARAFIPNVNNFPEINHKDENKTNNSVSNLEWCTTRYNLTYGHRLDCVKGENAPKHKLTEEQVKEIRAIYKKGSLEFGQSALSKKYGVSHQSIGAIVKGSTWKHLL